MVPRSLQASAAIALLAHGAAAWLFLHASRPAAATRASHSRGVLMLVAAAPSVRAPEAQPDPVPAAAAPVWAHEGGPAATPPAPRKDAGPDVTAHARAEAAPSNSVATKAAPTNGEFLAPEDLERVALPRSAPDTTMIAGLPWSGIPMRLRLYVNAAGTVVDVAVLQTADEDDVVEKVRQMFLATAFIPTRAHGMDVASYKDIELNVSLTG
jgi:hypothetical protein